MGLGSRQTSGLTPQKQDLSSSYVAMITRGAGTGAASASALLAQGWEVVICGRRKAPLEKVANDTGAYFLLTDVTSDEEMKQLVAGTVERFGSLGGLVLNAGIVRGGAAGTSATMTGMQWPARI